jgi:hypothetical protein
MGAEQSADGAARAPGNGTAQPADVQRVKGHGVAEIGMFASKLKGRSSTRLAKRLAEMAESRSDPAPHEGAEDEAGVWTAMEWVESLMLHTVVAGALSLPRPVQQYEYVKNLEEAEVRRLMSEAKLEGLADAVWEGVCSLQSQGAATGAALNDKFASESTFEMAYGGLELFYGGIEGLSAPIAI